MDYIRKHRGKLYDPNVVDALDVLVGRGDVGPREARVLRPQPAAALEVRRL
jgi:hypothetical protein